MSAKRRAFAADVGKEIAQRASDDPRWRTMCTATFSLTINLSYALYHGILGIAGRSWWFSALWAYYMMLGIAKFAAVLCGRKNAAAAPAQTEYVVMKTCGALLLALGCVLAGVNYMSMRQNIATQYGEITMIAIAAYTFGKLAWALARVIKRRRQDSPLLGVIRRIAYAETAVSILTLQRSMLVSFGAMDARAACWMNALAGAGVFGFVSFLGIMMIREGKNAASIRTSV